MSSRLIPPSGPARGLAFAQLVSNVGHGTFLVISALYFTKIGGLSSGEVGVGLTVGWAAGFGAGVGLGHVADRRGPRGVAVALSLAIGASVLAFLPVTSLLGFIVVMAVYASGQTGLEAARQALLAALIPPEGRTAARAHVQAAGNAGLGVGAVLGGLALLSNSPTGYRAVLAVNAVIFVAAAVSLARLPRVAPTAIERAKTPVLAVLRDRPFALVTALNAVMVLYMPMLSLAVPLWIAQRTQSPTWMASAVFLANTVLVMLFQVAVAKRVTDTSGAARTVRAAGFLQLAACGVFAASGIWAEPIPASIMLLVAVGVFTCGEMLLSAGTWEISFGLAPDDKQGQYQGFFGTGKTVGRTLGPVIMTTVVVGWGGIGWLVLGAAFALAGLAMPLAVRYAQRSLAASSREEPLPTVGGQQLPRHQQR